jgi:hypothetical protein
MIQNGAGQAEIPAVGFIAKRLIRRDSIETLILQGIGLQLGHNTYTAPFMLCVDKDSATLFRDCAESKFQLPPTIATQRSQHVPCQALGVGPNHWRFA